MTSTNLAFLLKSALLALILGSPVQAMTMDSLGLKEYHMLKHEAYDLSVIDRAERFLQGLSKANVRPSHCPLNQTTGQDLLEKLEQLQLALETSSCKEYKDSFLSNFSSSVNKIGSSYSSSQEYQAEVGQNTNENQQAHYRNINDMVGSLSGLVSDTRCAFDIKERGLIPVVSDILGSASVSALFMPNQYAFIAGMSGLAITASLKIISSLLVPDYDMSKPKDRENFVKLACSFYDLRSDLEKNNFLRVPSTRDLLNHGLATSYIDSLNSMIDWIEGARKESMDTLQASKDTFLRERLGMSKLAFYQDLPAMKEQLRRDERVQDNKDSPRSLSYRLRLVVGLNDIAQRLPYLQLDTEAYLLFSDINADMATLINYRSALFNDTSHQKTDQELSATFLEALTNIEEVLMLEVQEAEKAWRTTPVNDNTTFGQLSTSVTQTFDHHKQSLQALIDRISVKEKELNKIIARKNFTYDDEGTHIDHAIVEEIKTIQSAIYGHYGWRFFEYVRNGATKELATFHQNYQDFYWKYLPTPGLPFEIIESEHTRRIACATASNMLLSINNSRSLVNMAVDFIFTNRDFFHENIGEIDVHYKIIPTGRSVERQLLTEANSLIEAQEELAQSKPIVFPEIILKSGYFYKPHLADLMLGQTYAERLINPLYRFQVVNECGR